MLPEVETTHGPLGLPIVEHDYAVVQNEVGSLRFLEECLSGLILTHLLAYVGG